MLKYINFTCITIKKVQLSSATIISDDECQVCSYCAVLISGNALLAGSCGSGVEASSTVVAIVC